MKNFKLILAIIFLSVWNCSHAFEIHGFIENKLSEKVDSCDSYGILPDDPSQPRWKKYFPDSLTKNENAIWYSYTLQGRTGRIYAGHFLIVTPPNCDEGDYAKIVFSLTENGKFLAANSTSTNPKKIICTLTTQDGDDDNGKPAIMNVVITHQ